MEDVRQNRGAFELILGEKGESRGLYQSSKTRWICSHVNVRLTLSSRRKKKMIPARAEQGSWLEGEGDVDCVAL